jgi:hypothetical protein
MIPRKSRFRIVRRSDDNTYDIFYNVGNGKVDFVSNHDTYEEAERELEPATQEDINKFKQSFKEFFNKQQA